MHVLLDGLVVRRICYRVTQDWKHHTGCPGGQQQLPGVTSRVITACCIILCIVHNQRIKLHLQFELAVTKALLVPQTDVQNCIAIANHSLTLIRYGSTENFVYVALRHAV